MENKRTILFQKYELGRLLGQGTFAKVYYAKHIISGQSVAIKVIDKEKVLKVGLIDQIKREISVMRLVKHPNIVQLYEVMASKTKIYFAMEYVKGGELFKKITQGGRLKEEQAKFYFQQLISAIDFCHSRGVYHRDLKPENLLLDENGNLKIADFGLSALRDSRRKDGLLHTTCGTPGYVAPEVIKNRGYDGSKADVWSCGVILYVLLAGYLPFQDTNLIELYRKICKGEFKCPNWIPLGVRKLLCRIIDPNPISRITINRLKENPWFKKGFKYEDNRHNNDVKTHQVGTPRDVHEAFDIEFNGSNSFDSSKKKEEEEEKKPTCLNAFDLISLSPGFDLSSLFEEGQKRKSEARFTTSESPAMIMSRFEKMADMDRKFKIVKKDGMMKLHSNKEGRKGLLKIDAEIFQVSPSLHVLEVKKSSGDTIEYNEFCNKNMEPALRDIVWSWQQAPNSTSEKQETTM